jgi:hypothetical protein
MHYNQVGLKFDGTRQLLAYADACKEGGLEVNPEKTKYRCHQSARH